MIPHNRPTYDEAEERAVAVTIKAMANGKVGNIVETFEWRLADYFRTERAVCVASGLGALRLASIVFLDYVVQVPAYSCVALPNAVLAKEGFPVPKDEGPYDISVNTFGVPGEGIVQDITHGGPLWGVGVMSFGPTKLLAAGGGGVILCGKNDAEELIDLRDYADKARSGDRLNNTMSVLHASVGLVQLGKLPEMLSRRLAIGLLYNDILHEKVEGSFYRYVIQVENPETFIQAMAQQGVEVKRPLELWNDCPGAVEQYAHNVSLPCYPTLSEEDQDYVIEAVQECR